MAASQFPSDSGYPEASQATTALVLGILGIPFTILAPIAWWVSSQEIAAIHAGRRSPENLSLANTGRILGIIGTVLLAGGLILATILILGLRVLSV
jgi:hypothetical protein